MSISLLPKFTLLNPEQIEPALTDLLKTNLEKISALVTQKHFTWDNLLLPLEGLDNQLAHFWSPIAHLQAVKNTPEWRNIYDACQPLLADYATQIGQNERLYKAFQDLADSEGYHHLSSAQQKVIKDHLRDFKLSGVSLEPAKKQRYAEIQRRAAELATQFENNLVDATDGWHLHVSDVARLAGLSERALIAAQETAQQKGLEGWVFTLAFPSYYAVITYAEDRALRQEIYTAYVTRASDVGPDAGKWDNSQVMAEKLALRHELAQLLDFENYAELSLATKMADKPDQVIAFLTDLADKAHPKAVAEVKELKAFALQLGITDLQPWDISYLSEKLQQHKYAISEEELRPYFPEKTVIQGLFEVVKRLYKLRIEEKTGVDVWHPDVRFYEIYDEQAQLRGQFYIDLYARPQKRSGAWMDDYCSRWRKPNGELQIPIAFLTCNFAGPAGGKPALFSHEEVLTLFHEFGHGLHHLLTKVEQLDIAGINGVPWDAVELPSQFMENWAWEYEALQLISGHYETGTPLPKALYDRMRKAKNFQAAMRLMRQLELALFDFKLHYEYQPARSIQAVLDAIRVKVSVIATPAFNRFQHSFSHIFAGGYAAGYYSYLWADVLASDAFSRFQEEGIFNTQTGHDFLTTILEKGGSREPLALFMEFRGREPSIESFLRQYDLMVSS